MKGAEHSAPFALGSAPADEAPRSELAGLVQKVSAVKRVPLLRHEAGSADQTPQLFFRRPMMRSGSRDDIFLDHDASHIISSEPER
jgi:hypothetical protein